MLTLRNYKKKFVRSRPRILACGESSSNWEYSGCGRYTWTGCGSPPNYRYIGCGFYVEDSCGSNGCG